MSKVIRSVKNVTKGYSSVQIKVREGGSARQPAHGRAMALYAGSRAAGFEGIALLTAEACSD
jgi:hypothetical protein